MICVKHTSFKEAVNRYFLTKKGLYARRFRKYSGCGTRESFPGGTV